MNKTPIIFMFITGDATCCHSESVVTWTSTTTGPHLWLLLWGFLFSLWSLSGKLIWSFCNLLKKIVNVVKEMMKQWMTSEKTSTEVTGKQLYSFFSLVTMRHDKWLGDIFIADRIISQPYIYFFKQDHSTIWEIPVY